MVGTKSLSSQKGLLTRYCNNLSDITEKCKRQDLAASAPHDLMTMQKIRSAVFKLKATAKQVEDALSTFVSSIDAMDEPFSEEDESQTQQYINKAHDVLDSAQSLAIDLEASLVTSQHEGQIEWNASNTTAYSNEQVEAARPKLPAIPVPVFSGKLWEFENFWTLFDANIHSQPLSPLLKFTYLINALRGEARECVRRFTVTAENYIHAVNFLRMKYGDESRLIDHLQSRLERAKADKPTLEEQRSLLEYIWPLVSQLQDRGVSLDGSFITQKVLSKFRPDIQRKVLEYRLKGPVSESTWIMRNLLTDLDKVIETEERINYMMQKTVNEHRPQTKYASIDTTSKHTPRRTTSCIFCNADDHRSLTCPKYVTTEDRRKFFRDQERCMNCGGTDHFSNTCTKDGCKLCNGKKHHHTLCPERMKFTNKATAQSQYQHNRQKEPNIHSRQPEPKHWLGRTGTGNQQARKPAKVNAQAVDTEICAPSLHETYEGAHNNSSTAVLSTVENQGIPCGTEVASRKGVLLLTGVARVKGPTTKQLRNVELLLDTGADESFITNELANELGLVCDSQKGLNVYTFGSDKPKRTTCAATTLEVLDAQGTQHLLRLHTTSVLMAVSKVAHLSTEDLEFITQHNIRLSKSDWKRASKPQILLGCDQLWTLLDVPYPCYKLPSGFQLVPSKLGYLLSGRQDQPNKEREAEDISTTINSLVNFDEELERWDKYWTMDSAGICEFTGTKNAEKEATNVKVAAFFGETIQKRADGYYVRFPYKDNHPPLPTNKAIALKRLRAVIESLRKTPALLEAYDKTFKEQEEKGIIEEIPNAHCADSSVVHYIPHQPVVTPHKETTKLRIVFDASAHFRDSPSLNDVLHQGPLIFPELYAMLLRFRILKYVIISDVEKAFLQVHLQEADRDATRFLWVRNLSAPVDNDNIVTLRFTRVTYGLNVSPYLLAGTIHHHLKHEVEDQALAKEIQNNLYVDNLVLSAETEEEAKMKSLKARQIFRDMGMNLREFLSNDTALRQGLPEESCAKSNTHKVLGITWNALSDCLSMSCTLSQANALTKRIVTRQIASIYDPMGWLVPLLPAKKFQQDLWKQRFTWDAKLPPPIVAQWDAIIKNIDSFQISLPRRLMERLAPQDLAVFADASENAIAACAYIFNESSSALVMGRGKLPSVKTTITMPKLEMNALTLAARLALPISQAFKTSISERPWNVYAFSDSQIALSWLSSSKRKNLGVLVTNRLLEIRRIVQKLIEDGTNVTFAYVNTSENPADAGTRGLSKEELDRHIWWTGPSFLTQPRKYWYNTFYQLATDEDESERGVIDDGCNIGAIGSRTLPVKDLLCWERFSSLTTAKRVVAIVLRFLQKITSPLDQTVKERIATNIPELKDATGISRPLTAIEIKKARLVLIRNHQSIHLSDSYKKSMENTLRLYKDNNHLWRSRGRLGNALLKDETRSPFFIAPNTPLAKLIISEAHGVYHRGIEHTISTVRESYWIPKLRQQARKLISSCVKCRRFNALPYRYPERTDLPCQRVVRCRPFQNTGLDFFDLPPCKEHGKVIKLYGCIFTCTTTRLIHLEVVRSMATEEFINALRRFVARRGLPQTITCDNAPTFLLTKNILSQSPANIDTRISQETANKEIQWNHITPYAPWQGGFYERLIKSIKHAIYKTLGPGKRHSLDEINTFVAEVEATLNTRPLTYQGEAQEPMTSIRPIDFVHRNMTLTLPISENIDTRSDSDYLPPDSNTDNKS